MDETQTLKVMQLLGKLDERTAIMQKAIEGNGQKGLTQRVEELEAHRNRELGALAVLGTAGTMLWSGLEYWFHYRRH